MKHVSRHGMYYFQSSNRILAYPNHPEIGFGGNGGLCR